jgi:hypothetical protein
LCYSTSVEIPQIQRISPIDFTNMAQPNESNDRSIPIERQLRSFDRRIVRLEETQITARELNLVFERVYNDIEHLNMQMNARFDLIQLEMRELNNKFDIVMHHITGEGKTAPDRDKPN